MPSAPTASPESFTISREELVDVASDAECAFRVFTVLTGRKQNDLCDTLGDLADKILALFDPDGVDDEEVHLRGSEKAISWLDKLAQDEREWLEQHRIGGDDV